MNITEFQQKLILGRRILENASTSQLQRKEEKVEEETKKVIEAIGCENDCQTATTARFSKNVFF